MHKLPGYCDRWSVKPGGTIRFMVSSAGDAPYELRFARHICADPNPDGPGYREVEMPTDISGTQQGREQQAYLGSWGHAAGLPIDAPGGIALGATIWPTLPAAANDQGLVTIASGGWRFSLGLDQSGAFAEVATPDGTVRAGVATPMQKRRWYDLAASLGPDGTLRITQRARRPLGHIKDEGDGTASGAATPPEGTASVFLAALPGTDSPARAHFNGKLERPTIWRGAHDPAAIVALQRERVPHAATPDLIACWDFALGIPTSTATDIGPHGAHARLIALPTRAMTGATWTGAVHDWKHAPEHYAAIHFHEDDQGDLGWPESFALTVPEDWPSGFYSAHVSNAAGEDRIPFFVRPAKPRADVLFLVPTYTYQVYGCHVRPGRSDEIRDKATEWGAMRVLPDTNRQFGLATYNYHSDGSGVALVTMRRPMLDTRPKQMILRDPAPNGSGTARIGADSYIVDWLERAGIDADIATDHDLHEDGAALLAPYRVVIAGQHPEYYSDRMMQAMEDFLGGGGRLMYLGGNGFYWRCEPSEAEPHALEVRRAESGIRVWGAEAGEYYHQFGGGYGGLWRRIGRPAHRLVGNGFSVQGRHLGFPMRFTDGIRDPRVAFMTDGIDPAPGDVFGDAGFMGGGAAGFELDSADPHWGTPPNTIIVAKGIVIHEDYGPVNEDMLVLRHPRPREDWSCADVLFFETPAGGAVFSVGSMTYVGSLPVDNYGSTLTKLTTNVLRRFLDPAAFV